MTRPDRLYTRKVILASMSYLKAKLIDDIIKDSGYSRATVWNMIGELREEGIVHIGGWKKRTHFGSDTLRCGAPHAMYMRGKGPDVPRPPQLSKTEIQRAFRARARAAKQVREGTRAFSNILAQLGASE